MKRYPRSTHDYFAGFHTFTSDARYAFEVKWVPREGQIQSGWYWSQVGTPYWQGPFSSSREAFRAAKDTGMAALDNKVGAA